MLTDLPYKHFSPRQNSSTLSRLLKVVEGFGEAFAKNLECDNKTENGKIFSSYNISKALF